MIWENEREKMNPYTRPTRKVEDNAAPVLQDPEALVNGGCVQPQAKAILHKACGGYSGGKKKSIMQVKRTDGATLCI